MFIYIKIAIGVLLTSLFLFPFEFTFAPGLNTKLLMAMISLPILFFDIARKDSGIVVKGFIRLTICALMVSLMTFVSVVYNNTNDFAYVTYVISMFVWLGGAYTLLFFLQWTHCEIDFRKIVFYLAAACSLQCLIAILLSRSPLFYNVVHSFYYDLDGLNDFAGDRIYGIGCAFDVAGIRFAAVLIAMGFLLPSIVKKNNNRTTLLYLLSFWIIGIVGNMISRTTSTGLIIALCYILYYNLNVGNTHIVKDIYLLRKWMIGFLLSVIAIVFLLYNIDLQFQNELRFGFEGFFSLIEDGTWEVRSNRQLISMYIFPESSKTWIIGDGYFENTTSDPYYTGKTFKEYYMGVDVGYLRFIYYSGLSGLAALILFFYQATHICMRSLSQYKVLFFFMFILQLIVWLKVSSDLFAVLALFLVLSMISKKHENV